MAFVFNKKFERNKNIFKDLNTSIAQFYIDTTLITTNRRKSLIVVVYKHRAR